MPVGALGDGRALWVMVFTETIADVIRPAEVRAAAVPGVPGKGPLMPVPAPGRRVLLARDGGAVNPRIAGVLRDAGFQVVMAEPGAGVIEKMQAGDFDRVVLEINRSGSQGPAILRQVRERLPGSGVMVISRLLTLRQKQEVALLGVGEVITQDLNGPELLEKLDGLTAGAGTAA
jgi:DNA-binding response OmpR family regulator